MSGSHAVQATVAADGGNVSSVDSTVYFVSSSGGRIVGMDMAAPKGHGRAGSAGVFNGFGGQARSRRCYTESSVECVVVSLSGSAGWRNGMGGRFRAGKTITAGAGRFNPGRVNRFAPRGFSRKALCATRS